MSELSVTTISDLAGTGPVTLTKQSAAKAWVQYDMRTSAHIDESVNVSSLTDNATGEATLAFSSSFGSADYGVAATAGRLGASDNCIIRVMDNSVLPTVSAIKMYTFASSSGNASDTRTNGVTIHGDLA